MLRIISLFIAFTALNAFSLTTARAGAWSRQDGDLIKLPVFAPLQNEADIVALKLRIADTGAAPSPYATFGQYFKKGDLPQAAALRAYTPSGTEIPIQVNIKNRHLDNSVRHAIITLKINAPKNGELYDILLRRGEQNVASQTNVRQTQDRLPDIKVRLLNQESGLDKTVSLRKTATRQKGDIWFSGSHAVQKRYSAAVAASLIIDFDVTTYADGRMRTDVAFRYDRLNKTPMRPAYYDAVIYNGDKVIEKLDNIEHTHHTAFRKIYRFGYRYDNPTALNPVYLSEAGAIPAYDFTNGVNEEAIEANFEALANPEDPEAARRYGLLNPYMPATGGRPDLGILPLWTTQYLLTADDRARYVMMKHADVAAMIPWRFFDETTGEPPLPENYPNLWIDYRATPEKHGIKPYNPQDKAQSGSSKWVPDTAHQPSLTYLPYLITGDRFYYDTLKAQYFFNKFFIDPQFLKDRTLRTQYIEQVRAYGWIQRTAGQFILVAPDSDPASAYAKKQFDKDFNFLYDMFIKGKYYNKGRSGLVGGELTGYLDGWGSDDGRQNPLFMQDLAAMSIAWLADAGFVSAAKLTAAQVNFISGRFLQKYNGYDPRYATVYKFNQFIPDAPDGVDTPLGKKKVYATWKEVFDYSVKTGYFAQPRKEIAQNGLPGWPKSADGYVAYARATQASVFNAVRDPRAIEAYGFLVPYFDEAEAAYENAPTFLISPRFKDGTIMTRDMAQIGGSFSNTLEAETPNALLYGDAGDDTLKGGSGEVFAFGGVGDDTIFSGEKGGYLFGGEGQDRLIGSKGDDYFKGDPDNYSQKDQFVFTSVDFGNDVIKDFTPGTDKIVFYKIPQLQAYTQINTVYGIRNDKDGENRTKRFYQQVNPESDEDTYVLLAKAAGVRPAQEADKGPVTDKEREAARQALRISDAPNNGLTNYIRPSFDGDTLIDLNFRLTDDQRAERDKQLKKEYDALKSGTAKKVSGYGTLRLIGVKPKDLQPDDFIFINGGN